MDANPEAYEHARARYRHANLSFRRGLVEEFDEPVDAVVFLQTIEHIHEPDRLLVRIAAVAPGGVHLDPQPAHAGPAWRREIGQPLAPARVRPAPSIGSCWSPTSGASSCSASSTPASCGPTSSRIRLGWDRVHPALHLTKPFYDRFIPAITLMTSACKTATSTGRWTSCDLPQSLSDG